MILARVCGEIHSTINHPFYDNRKLLIADRLGQDGKPSGGYIIAIDVVGAGVGETVLILDEGNGARKVLDDPQGPVRSVIIGIVDEIQTY